MYLLSILGNRRQMFNKPPKLSKVTHTKRQTDIHKLDSPEAIAAKIVETIEKGITVEFI